MGVPRRVSVVAGAFTVVATITAAGTLMGAPPATADNSRLNSSVVSNVYTVQRQAGCTGELVADPRLRLAAQQHAVDLVTTADLNGDTGSDGSTVASRANAAGFSGPVAETVATNPALAISSLQLINQWYFDPAALAIMQDCRYTKIGVWSENSLARTVVVAVYGQPVS